MDTPDHQAVRATVDLRTAVVLGAAYGLTGAVAAAMLIGRMDWTPPLPTPAFAAVLALQLTLIYGLFAWAGLRLARRRSLEPAPTLTGLWMHRGLHCRPRGLRDGILGGLASGAMLVALVRLIRALLPGTLPELLHPPGIATALAASAAASFGEEILCRLLLLSALLALLPPRPFARPAAITASSIAFGVLHLPGMVMLFGDLAGVPPLAWVWIIGLNAIVGAVFGVVYLRHGIGAAITAHFCCNLVWHVGSAV